MPHPLSDFPSIDVAAYEGVELDENVAPEPEPFTEAESKRVLEMMRHAVGMDAKVRVGMHGQRNRFYAHGSSHAARLWRKLVAVGLAVEVATIVNGVVLFAVTRDGCAYIGLSHAATCRACQGQPLVGVRGAR